MFISVPENGLLCRNKLPVEYGEIGDGMVSLCLSDPINRLIMEKQL